ncbi:hypothetical protein AK812_SmicGene33104 [Symbiodinium microadriaticum]|uniref:Uncharacterized protein n=1 Tax=Symbiodinium microadriaticum TaxID=2951 RepID=A0A1Q9CSI2_SYMMI|nr:hypothetical protein AK812_SmicGene33104 [Symbiodinium microadriaticum]
MEKVLEYCWKARENFKHENPGVDPASFEDLQDHKPLFYQPAGPLPTLEEHREINHADVNVHGNSSPQEVLKILRARKDQKTLHAYYTLVEDRLSGKSKPEDMLEGINPDRVQKEAGFRGDDTTDVVLIHHHKRTATYRYNTEALEACSCHGAVCRIGFGTHGTNEDAKEFHHPFTGQRLTTQEYQEYVGMDPLMGKDMNEDRPEKIEYQTPDLLASTAELSQEQCTCAWGGFNDGADLTAAEYETFYDQNAAVELGPIFTKCADYKSQMSHKESTRSIMTRDLLNAELPYKPHAIAGNVNNLCSKMTCQGGDVHPRTSLTLYLEEMLHAVIKMPQISLKSASIKDMTVEAQGMPREKLGRQRRVEPEC